MGILIYQVVNNSPEYGYKFFSMLTPHNIQYHVDGDPDNTQIVII